MEAQVRCWDESVGPSVPVGGAQAHLGGVVVPSAGAEPGTGPIPCRIHGTVSHSGLDCRCDPPSPDCARHGGPACRGQVHRRRCAGT